MKQTKIGKIFIAFTGIFLIILFAVMIYRNQLSNQSNSLKSSTKQTNMNYSNEKLVLIKEYIKTGSEEIYHKNLNNRQDIIMVVDWREFDEDIINYCEEILKTNQLSVETIDADNKQGFETIITYKGKKTIIPYKGEGSDRDTTIITLNEVIQPDYEIRVCKISEESDTLEFIPLPKEVWNDLEKEYPNKLNNLFGKINRNSKLFE